MESRKILDLRGKTKKQLPLWQAYSTLYYQKKLKDTIQASWKELYLRDNPEHDEDAPIPAVSLGYQNQKMRELYDSEMAEVKAKVEAFQQSSKDEGEYVDEWEDDDEIDEEERQRRAQVCGYQR